MGRRTQWGHQSSGNGCEVSLPTPLGVGVWGGSAGSFGCKHQGDVDLMQRQGAGIRRALRHRRHCKGLGLAGGGAGVSRGAGILGNAGTSSTMGISTGSAGSSASPAVLGGTHVTHYSD